MTRGYVPPKPFTIVTEEGDTAALDAVNAKAAAAQATADNARQMVLNRDPRLSTLEGIAATVQQALADSESVHANLASGQHDEANNRAAADATLQTSLTAMAARVSTLEIGKPVAVGTANTPALALLATQDVNIPLSRTMPDSDYTIELARTSGLIPNGTVTLKAKTPSSVTYTVKAVLALGAGTITVLAHY